MMIFPLIIFIIILVLIFNSESITGISNMRNQGGNALEILNHRFATGEISEEEYLRKKSMLMNK